METSATQARLRAVALAVGAASLVAHAPWGAPRALPGWDDLRWVIANPATRPDAPLRTIFDAHDGALAPVTQAAYWLLARVAPPGALVGAVRATEALLAGAIAILLALVLRRRGAGAWSEPLAALFTLHPHRVETFGWAANLRDPLALLLILLAARAWLDGQRRWVAWAAAAVLAKTMVVLLPLAFPLLGRARLGPEPSGRLPLQPAPSAREPARSSPMPVLTLPDPSLVVLVGPSGAGKSTFAARCFAPSEIVSSDALRAMVADDEGAQDANDVVFDLLHRLVDARLQRRRLTVVDATNLEREARARLLDIGRANRLPLVALHLDGPRELFEARNRGRARVVPAAAMRRQLVEAEAVPAVLASEGWDAVQRLDAATLGALTVRRDPLPPLRHDERGPFDIVGDVHGCLPELLALLDRLGYAESGAHTEGRRLVFVGDLVDRGPDSVGVLRLVLPMLESGRALFVPGNHDDKLWRWLAGNPVRTTGGLATTVAEWGGLSEPEDRRLRDGFDRVMRSAPPYLWLDGGSLLVAHAGLEERDHGRVGAAVRAFCLYGKTTGREIGGYPERLDWAADYQGAPLVVHGHVPTREAVWRNGVADIDLGACFGGALCAMRWPERTFVQVPSARPYWEGSAAWAAAGAVPT